MPILKSPALDTTGITNFINGTETSTLEFLTVSADPDAGSTGNAYNFVEGGVPTARPKVVLFEVDEQLDAAGVAAFIASKEKAGFAPLSRAKVNTPAGVITVLTVRDVPPAAPGGTPRVAAGVFVPPPHSAQVLARVRFDQALPTTPDAKARFDKEDQLDPGDPSHCKALLQFPDKTVFWSSKMAIDGDGPAAGPGHSSGSQLDPFPDPSTGQPEGQDDTSLHFTTADVGLPAEAVTYIVLPHDPKNRNIPFHPDLAIGNVAMVVFEGVTVPAVCGDIGPAAKIGEGSIRVHELLHEQVQTAGAAPDPCRRRDPQTKVCRLILNASIPQDVLFFVFPGTTFTPRDPATIEAKIKEIAEARFQALGGSV